MKNTFKTNYGTCYFPSIAHAEFYYHGYIGGNVKPSEISQLVRHKLESKEIHIGKPELKSGQELKLIDNRWHICEEFPSMIHAVTAD